MVVNVLVFAAFLWLMTAGTWVQMPAKTFYYDWLASAFRHGQLAIEQKPPAAMLALANPYDPAQRVGIPQPWDVSLYKGQYFLYWGPLPALLLMVVKLFTASPISDSYPLLAFQYSLFLVESVLLFRIWRRFMPDMSLWVLTGSLFLIGLGTPAPWIIELPAIYSAAVSAGAAFFMAGLLAAFVALDHNPPRLWWLALAGLFWATSVGSRISQVLPVGLACLFILLALLRGHKLSEWRMRARPIAALGVPLLLGTMALCWYNWARFDSIFETGIKYQLAGVPVQQYGNRMFSPVFMVQNTYVYFLYPPVVRPSFPYFRPARELNVNITPLIPLPEMWNAQETTGLLLNSPWIVLGMAAVYWAVRRRPGIKEHDTRPWILRWMIGVLAGTFGAACIFFLMFFWAAERYLFDFIPPLLILGVLGMWQIERWLRGRKLAEWFGKMAIGSMATYSILVSVLIAVSIQQDAFRKLNPVLWRMLSNLVR